MPMRKNDEQKRHNSLARLVSSNYVEMKLEELGYGHGGQAPAMVMGGYQMENNLLVFDEENQELGYGTLLLFRQTTYNCFNFTMAAYWFLCSCLYWLCVHMTVTIVLDDS
ncbi:unnamed protein product [Urochloa humidicola]